MGKVLALFVAPAAGKPMQEKKRCRVIMGAGLHGDRYAKGVGFYSNQGREAVRHITLISREAIDAGNAELADLGLPPFTWAETRRNVVVEGIDLNPLVGRPLQIGSVILLGSELATPCQRPSMLAKKRNFGSAFQGRGGVRFKVLCPGQIAVGQNIVLL